MNRQLAHFVRDLSRRADTLAVFANELVDLARVVLRIERLPEYRSACVIPGLVPRAGLGNRGVGPTRCEPGDYEPTGPPWGRFAGRLPTRAGNRTC